MSCNALSPDLSRVWIFEDDDTISIGEILGFVRLGGTGQYECFNLRFTEGTRSTRALTALDPPTWVTYYRGPEPCEYYLKIEVDSEGRTLGEVVTRDDIELETDDVPNEFYE